MAFYAGKSCPVPSVLLFILTIATGVLCQELKMNYTAPYRSVTKGNRVQLHCICENPPNDSTISIKWHKIGEKSTELKSENGIIILDYGIQSWLRIEKANKFHSGIYYCSFYFKNSSTHKCGAEVNVITRSIDIKKLKAKHTLKDMLILIQAILLILCLTLPGMLVFNKNNRTKKTDDEGETYHMYEGLEVMQTAMYEDIGNVRPAEAKWTVGEQPNE
ncbi:B-cell antigen receptor complex-associated protein beta chain-like [Heptranchias perlo]|uniref:B-cell antigen receptor complex-associated protein beta chain-like n=1 Tax=Heptranchias perlo TaxID=212740 RepID=UPI003559FB14